MFVLSLNTHVADSISTAILPCNGSTRSRCPSQSKRTLPEASDRVAFHKVPPAKRAHAVSGINIIGSMKELAARTAPIPARMASSVTLRHLRRDTVKFRISPASHSQMGLCRTRSNNGLLRSERAIDVNLVYRKSEGSFMLRLPETCQSPSHPFGDGDVCSSLPKGGLRSINLIVAVTIFVDPVEMVTAHMASCRTGSESSRPRSVSAYSTVEHANSALATLRQCCLVGLCR